MERYRVSLSLSVNLFIMEAANPSQFPFAKEINYIK